MFTLKTTLYAFLIASTLGLAACQREGPMERAGKAVDNAGQKVGNEAEKAGDKVKDAVNDAKK